MRNYLHKLLKSTPIYIISLLACTLGCWQVRKLADAYHFIDIPEKGWEYTVPVLITLVCTFLILLGFKKVKVGNNPSLRLVAVAAIGCSIGLCAINIQKAYSEKKLPLRHVANVYEMPEEPEGNYYTLDSFHLVKSYPRRKMTRRVEDDIYGKRYRYTFYYILPMSDHFLRPEAEEYRCWYAQTFDMWIAVNKPEQEILSESEKFFDECTYAISIFDYTEVSYFEILKDDYHRLNIKQIASNKYPVYTPSATDDLLVLQPHLEPFEQRNIEAERKLYITMIISIVIFLIAIALLGTVPKANQ